MRTVPAVTTCDRFSFTILSYKPLEAVSSEITAEHRTTDAGAQVLWTETAVPAEVVSADFKEALISAIYACPNGIYRMSPDIEGLVQTSNNLARVAIENGQLVIMCLTRSAVESEKMEALGLHQQAEFIHFGLTSQDVNNTAIPLSIKEYHEDIFRPALEDLLATLKDQAQQWKDLPMLARTHGQPASPTRLGKEW
ncbi:lyase family protein, partial [Marivivens sp.]|uniref:lyase family protein n=1 Tax=Marivivens sp. TaxID=1978374 RepID=UPI00345C547F